ncbi:type II toxin-antitoxin system VapC family toxin [Candidatus Symbiobacter mobilis]|uniref:PIN domain nucleic acid-binding-like protein n=1 Tax=Candidatus Symbiobacter mobilis CR TaxID=946483 RepID=U5NB17_9BURK|nr:PIN domain nuclease [Candidatus Symbiobacter mobilis]AGX87423.1 PIN domain nucleic acid-binding-like protein [Candidatus Symbiobacter mobilis CR]
MILVDSSVWIDYFRGMTTPQTCFLRDEADRSTLVVGDLILCEVLQGFRHNEERERARMLLLGFHYRDMVGQAVALEAAKNYSALRVRGITIRKTIDVLIGTFCLRNGFALLHADRDFDPLAEHLGLHVWRSPSGDGAT